MLFAASFDMAKDRIERAVRQSVIAALIIGIIVAALPTTPAARAQDSDTIVIGVTDLPTTLDVGEAYDFAAWEVLSHLYTGLTRQVPGTFEYELALAENVAFSADRLTATFTLPADAAFTDGTPITAQTFVDSINRVLAIDRGAVEAVEPYIAAVSAPEPTTLVFDLNAPVPYFLGLVALPPFFPQHPDLLASEDPDPFPSTIIGNGPYLLESFAVNEAIMLRANPDYRTGNAPQNDVIVLRQFNRSQDLREAFLDGSVDLAWRALLLRDVDAIAEAEVGTLMTTPSTRAFYLYMNHRLEPGDDPLVRRAVTLMVSRNRLMERVFGNYATPLFSVVPPIFPEAHAAIWPQDADSEEGEATLLSAAYRPRNRSRLELTIVTSRLTYGDIYAAAASELVRDSFALSDYISSGLQVEVDRTTFLSTLERGEGRIMLFGWTPIVPHPAAYLRPLAHSDAMIPSRGAYARSELDETIDAAALLSDPAEAGPFYQSAAAMLLETYDIIPLWQDHVQIAYQDTVSGVQIEGNFFLHYDQLAKE